MKILYVFFHSYQDMPYHTREWVEAAIQLGHEITVITAIDSNFLKTIEWHDKIDIVQVNYPGSGIINYFQLLKNFKEKVTKFINATPPDLIYERFSPISPATAKVAKKTKSKYCIEINGIIEDELALSGASWLRRYFFKKIQKKVYPKASSIITVTAQIKDWLIKKYQVPESKIKTFSNGVNLTRFTPLDKNNSRKQFALPENKLIVGFLGSLYPWNGLPCLIDAAKILTVKFPELLFLIGGGQEPMKSELKQEVMNKKLEDFFIFSGQIPWHEAAAYISSF